MSFKLNFESKWRSFLYPISFLAVFLAILFLACFSFSQTIDSILAVVNGEVITLIDLRVVETFGLQGEIVKKEDSNSLRFLLERLVDQKLVVQVASEEATVGEEELDSSLTKVIEFLGSETFDRKLEEFGMSRDDLKTYLKEKILYEKIISRKFSQGNIVSLQEIEDFYNQTYLPGQKSKELAVKPLMEVFDEIESAIRKEKIRVKAEAWLSYLKKKADIEVRLARLEEK